MTTATAEVDLIHRMAAAIERKDFDDAEALLDPEIVWEHNLGEGTPEEGVYRGREEVIGLFRRLLDVWREIRIEVGEIRAPAPHSFEARGTMHFAHAATEAEIAMPYVQTFDFRDGRAVHVALNISMSGSPKRGS